MTNELPSVRYTLMCMNLIIASPLDPDMAPIDCSKSEH